MHWYYIFVFLGFVLFGEVLLIASKAKLKVMLLYLGVSISIVFLCLKPLRAEFDRADRQSRTTTVTAVVVEDTRSMKGDKEEWFESFKLKGMPHTFSFKRDKFCQWGVIKGDVVKVTFIAPKEPDGQADLLDVYDLDREIEKIKYSSPALEALPADCR